MPKYDAVPDTSDLKHGETVRVSADNLLFEGSFLKLEAGFLHLATNDAQVVLSAARVLVSRVSPTMADHFDELAIGARFTTARDRARHAQGFEQFRIKIAQNAYWFHTTRPEDYSRKWDIPAGWGQRPYDYLEVINE